MKTTIAFLLLSLSPFFVTVTQAAPNASAQPKFTAQQSPLPQTKGRTGSKRVGGYTSHGKDSRYIGSRR